MFSERSKGPLDAVIFDLDGTLWDTCDACAVSWNRVLARHSIAFRAITASDVRAVTGRPHDECIRQVFRGLPEEQLRILGHETQTEDNRVIAELGGKLYPDVKAGLSSLQSDHALFIVSNCQAGYIETFIDTNALSGVFAGFECWGRTGLSKAENLGRVVTQNRLRRAVFVGDTPNDQQAAVACRLPFVHVSYGFGSCPGSVLSAASFSELVALVKGWPVSRT
jgi:phosphoglycolate phosphatase